VDLHLEQHYLPKMLSLASSSSSRLTASTSPILHQVRHAHGKPRYPKRVKIRPLMPQTRNPHFPRLPLPSSGASQSHPLDLIPQDQYVPSTSSTKLDSTDYTFHYTPPASAPSYTTGVKPDLLRWLGGESVTLSGEEAAPLMREGREPIGHLLKTLDETTLRGIQQAREQGLTRSMVAKRSVTIKQQRLKRV